MFGRKQDVPHALGLPSGQPEAPELPAGYRLRRVGPAQWVAEPSRYRVRLWVTAIVACVVGGGLGIHGTRLYYHRKAQAPLVVVNGVVIRRDNVRHDLERLHGVRLVQRLVSDELVRQFATAKGAWPTEAEVERRFRVERKLPGFEEELVRAGLTEEDYRARLRVRLAHVNLVIKGVEATEADARSFYERNIDPRNPRALFRHPARAQIAVIASSTKEAATKARYELIRDEPWPRVVAKYSIHPSRTEAGLLPPIARGRSIFSRHPAAEAVVFGVKEGARSEIFEMDGRWWIVRCIKRWPASVVAWETARDDAMMGARIEIGAVRNAADVAKARNAFVREAVIQAFDPMYESVTRPNVSLTD